jgi:hypothetical protein
MPTLKMVTIMKTYQVVLRVPDEMPSERVLSIALGNLPPDNTTLVDTTVRVNDFESVEIAEREIIDLTGDGGSD